MNEKMKNKQLLKDFLFSYFQCIKKNIAYIVIGLFLSIISQICTLIIPLLFRFILDEIIADGYFSYLYLAVSVGIGVALLFALTSFFANYFLYISNGLSGLKFKTMFFGKMQMLPICFFEKKGSNIVTHRILFDLENVIGYWTQTLATIPLLFTFVIGIIIMVKINIRLTFYIVLVSFVQFLITISFSKSILRVSYQIKQKNEKVTSTTINFFSRIELTRTHAREKEERNIFFNSIQEQFNTLKKYFLLGKGYSNTNSFMSYLWVFIVLLAGGMLVKFNVLSLGSLLAFIMLLNVINGPLFKFSELIISFQDMKTAILRCLELYKLEPYIQIRDERHCVTIGDDIFPIIIKNVSFSYIPSKPILKNVNLTIYNNEIIGIVGKSGVGKSTFCKLLPRLYDIDCGEIIFNKNRISDIQLDSLRDAVHLTLQNMYVFNDTLWNNLTYGIDREIDEESVKQAMLIAGIDFFNKLDSGFDTTIGMNGTNLSVGEIQRIAIARTILLKPKLFVFDEPTSSVDPKTEIALHQTFLKLRKECSVIIITHRKSTLQILDRVFFFENGSITEELRNSKKVEDFFDGVCP